MAISKEKDKEKSEVETKPRCGIIMPISPIDGCGSDHWIEILNILKDVAIEAGFEPNLVSDADQIGIIQKRIIQNIYNNDIVICDVSGKNPNVMFELGMRLAFDKATIIIKDDITDYSFDTGVIEHLGYPRDLRFHRILEFKENLLKKLKSTYQKATDDPNYSTFLKSFGEYKIAHLQEKEVSSDNYILGSLEEIRFEIKRLRQTQINSNIHSTNRRITLENKDNDSLKESIVAKYYREFLRNNDIKRMSDLHMLKEDLIQYIISQSEIKEICDSEVDARRIIDKVIS